MSTPNTAGPAPIGAGPAPHLSRTDLDVLRRIASGQNHQQIADELHFARGAVSMKLLRIRRRFDAATVAQVVYLTTRAGLLDLGTPPYGNTE